MTSIASAAPAANAAASPIEAGGLAVDKAACEKKLADWVHCVSATTPQGKAKIRELTNQLQTIDAKIQKATEAKDAAPASTPSDTVGNVVDVYA